MDQDYVDKQIDAKIIEINNNDNIYEVGTVVNVKDFIIEVTGVNNVMFYEKINIANKALGYVNSINENTVTIAVLKIDAPINIGDMVYSTNTLYTGSYSPSSIGRVIDLFGEDKLSGKKYNELIDIPIERKTIPIMDRGTVNRPLLTGISGIDLMYPIGRGQRQLIIGDKRTGKTQIGLDTIVNQKGQNVLCFYVAIGKTKKEVKNIYSELMKRGALDYTTIITAFNDELPPVISLIPYFSLSVAENYMMDGYDVLVVIDDLKRHAEAYREISLISGKTPGRDAYPADIFYTHSRLLEKGCQHKNGGSITILPIVETKGGDITDYISTNVISITDGQIVLSDKSFQKGEKPAINYGLSVSRLGGAVQEKDMKAVGSVVRRKLLSYLETRSVYELVNMDEMSPELKNQFMEGKIILNNLMQYKFSPKTPQEMMAMFSDIVETDNKDKVTDENKEEKYLSSNNEDSVFDRNNQPIPEDGSIFDGAEPIASVVNPDSVSDTAEDSIASDVNDDFEQIQSQYDVPNQEQTDTYNYSDTNVDTNYVNNIVENFEENYANQVEDNNSQEVFTPVAFDSIDPVDTNIMDYNNSISDFDNVVSNEQNVNHSDQEVNSEFAIDNTVKEDSDYAEEPIIQSIIVDDEEPAINSINDDVFETSNNTYATTSDIFDGIDINQNVLIDNPLTEEDESIEERVVKPEEVTIDYDLEEKDKIKEEVEDKVSIDDSENDGEVVYEEDSMSFDIEEDSQDNSFVPVNVEENATLNSDLYVDEHDEEVSEVDNNDEVSDEEEVI